MNRSFEKLQISGKEADAVFFHLPEEPDGYLSNWYISPFELDGIRYSSAEQYIMYQKCVMFGDTASAEAVLSTDDPAKQQGIGRKASGFIGSVWSGMCQIVAYKGLLEKFRQNPGLKTQLLSTGDAYLVECARTDKIWACGIRLDDPNHLVADQWDGKNLLGFTLMQVRSTLLEEEKRNIVYSEPENYFPKEIMEDYFSGPKED